ncbi:hypothetical protein ACI7BZ_11805 [Xanthobacter sp. AM11]|uniref:hypothetical protein n=1 Tax=Xanthobacter sp. AM11 TaxID=3380643 RepID=UPI0039BF8B99
MRRGTGRGGVAALVLLAAALAAAPAGAMMIRHTLGPVDRRIVARIEAGAIRAGLATTAAEWFVTFDQNDDGVIDWQDDALALQLQLASRRAMGVAFVLAMDLDATGW